MLAMSSAASCGTRPPQTDSAPSNYIFFRRDHERIREPEFLLNPGIAGAQLTYTWRELEPERDRYDFAAMRAHLAFLDGHGKRLFVQIQDVSFSETILTPEYLRTDSAFHGGVERKYERARDGRRRFDGWVARRWDPAVRARFALLLDSLGREFDGRIEGIVLAETAIGFNEPESHPPGFTYEGYAAAIREMMSAARQAFARSCVVIYANFMPGEQAAGEKPGFLRSIYAHAANTGVGVGGPDILPHRRFQRAHSLPLIAGREAGVVGAMAVQDGNLADLNPATRDSVTVEEIHRYASDELHLDYIFWGTEEPYYSASVLPYLRELGRR
jgi:hypothetical protein